MRAWTWADGLFPSFRSIYATMSSVAPVLAPLPIRTPCIAVPFPRKEAASRYLADETLLKIGDLLSPAQWQRTKVAVTHTRPHRTDHGCH